MIEIQINPNEYEMIVFDAPNVVTTEIVEDGGDPITGIFPERLQEAVDYCQELGWPVMAFLKHGTWLWATRNSGLHNIGDVMIFDRLIKSDLLELVGSEKEDIFFIDYAISNSALIVTKDKFREERKNHPDRDWDEIEKSTLRDYEFVDGGQFILPSLPPKKDGTRLSFKGIKSRINELEKRLELLESMMHSSEKHEQEIKHEWKKEDLDSVVKEVFDSLLREGEAIHMTMLLHTLASAILGLDLRAAAKGVWPEDWKKTLMESLGVEGKMMKWVEELSPRDLKLTRKTGFVSYS